MSINLISLKCPECGAQLKIEDDRPHIFCMYCGTKILIHNENEFIYRHIDEAGLKQAETDRIVKLKQMEFAERARQAAEASKRFRIILALSLGLIGIVVMVVGGFLGEATGNPDSSFYMLSTLGVFPLFGALFIAISFMGNDADEIDYGDKIKVPSSISGYDSKNYVSIEHAFKSAGFTNITCVPLNDLTTGLLKKPNTVESITINGKQITSGGKKFFSDAAIVISYHSFAYRK